MTTHVPPQDEQPADATRTGEELQAAMPTHSSAPQPVVLPRQPEEDDFFSFEEEQPDLEAAFAAPFQRSNALPTVSRSAQPSDQGAAVPREPAVAPTQARRMPRFSLMMIAILVSVVAIVGLLAMNALAQTTPPLQSHGNGSSQTAPSPGNVPKKPEVKQQKATMKPTPVPPAPQLPATTGQGQTTAQTSSEWVPPSLPAGWTNAGLLTGDGIQAIRTAVAFNDREMSLDSRSVGTRANHGGTFTAATFAMTPAARQRFQQNDVRAINNTLFDMVVTTRLIRLVVNPQPRLITFAQQGQQQFAWVDVAFQLWQSRIDPNNPKPRVEGKELDPATNQPRIHHMMVLLLRVPAQDAENNPAMGGTGWLVSNYALDLPNGTALNIVHPA